MFLRCAKCHDSFWIPNQGSADDVMQAACSVCGQTYRLHGMQYLGRRGRDLYHKARDFAEQTGIDLPAAFSVIFGLTTVEEVWALTLEAGGPRPGEPQPPRAETLPRSDTGDAAAAGEATAFATVASAAPAAPADAPADVAAEVASHTSVRERSRAAVAPAARRTATGGTVGGTGAPSLPTVAFDRRYEGAVRAGTITPAVASLKGDREAMIARLVERHGLSASKAGLVVDNRISLLAAVRSRDFSGPVDGTLPGIAPTPAVPGGRPARAFLGAVLVIAALSAAFILLSSGPQRPEGSSAPETRDGQAEAQPETDSERIPVSARASVDVSRDDDGRVLIVSGADPASVLIEYCRASRASYAFSPVRVVPADPPSPRTRLGVLRDAHDLEDVYVITIRQDRWSGRWFAGDGESPLIALRAPDKVLQTLFSL